MRTFDRYILSHLLMVFGFFSLILVAVYWVNRAVSLFDRLIADGSNVSLFLELTLLTLPSVILTVLPISALVATLYGVNRLSGESELVVAQTTGLSPWTMARPVMFFGLCVAVLLSLLAHVLVPVSRTMLVEQNRELSQDISGRFLKDGEFLHPGTGITVYVREITEQGELRGVFLQDRRDARARTTYTAERAVLLRAGDSPRLVMFEGSAQTLHTETRSLTVVSFADFTYDLAGLVGGPVSARQDPRSLDTATLLRAEAQDLARDDVRPGVYLFEGHNRFAEPIFAAALPVLAIALLMLGSFSRLGLWRQILAAVFLAILLKLTSNVVENAVRGSADLWPLTYLPALLTMGMAALALSWNAYVPRRLGREAAS